MEEAASGNCTGINQKTTPCFKDACTTPGIQSLYIVKMVMEQIYCSSRIQSTFEHFSEIKTTELLMTDSSGDKMSPDNSNTSLDHETGALDWTIIGILIGLVTILIAAGLCVYCWEKKRRNQPDLSKASGNSVPSSNDSISKKTVPQNQKFKK